MDFAIKPADRVLSRITDVETGLADSPTNGLEENIKPADQTMSGLAPLEVSFADTSTSGLEVRAQQSKGQYGHAECQLAQFLDTIAAARPLCVMSPSYGGSLIRELIDKSHERASCPLSVERRCSRVAFQEARDV